MAADSLGERGRAADDARWGRLGGAHPPLRASVPLVGWLLSAVVVTAVVLGVVGGPGPLDDPSQGDQRPGFIVDPDEARVVPGLRLPGARVGRRPVFVAFDRRVPPSDRLRDGVDDVAEGFAVVLVVPTAPVRQVAAVPVAVDPAGRIARAVGIDRPKDGGPPIGYAIVDDGARVRYATIDPTWTRQGFEVTLLTEAVR